MRSNRVKKLQARIFFQALHDLIEDSTQLKSQHYFSPLQNANMFKIQHDANEPADI